MAPKIAIEELNGFEASILSVLAQLPPTEKLEPKRQELLNRLSGKARLIANALIDESSADPGSDERRTAEALIRWGRGTE